MKQDEVKVGDVVELMSGGPPMTVAEVNIDLLGDCTVVCKWFFGKMETTDFSPDVLKPSKPRDFEALKSSYGGLLSGSPSGDSKNEPAKDA
jgi:uncharacterized protein YodC (DUF2158 family)